MQPLDHSNIQLAPVQTGDDQNSNATLVYAGYTIAAIAVSGLFVASLGRHCINRICKAIRNRVISPLPACTPQVKETQGCRRLCD